jgi:hypothetical protein
MACDEIKQAIYHNGLYGNEFDMLALLVTIHRRRVLSIGEDPGALEEDCSPLSLTDRPGGVANRQEN